MSLKWLILCVLLARVEAVYLTWVEDPAHTMVVRWLGEKQEVAEVYYVQEGQEQWQRARGEAKQVGGIWLYSVEIKGLKCCQGYGLRLGLGPKEYRFRTMPEEGEVKFAVGGDAYHGGGKAFRAMNRQVAAQGPDFVVMGGDIAYATQHWVPVGKATYEVKRWREFFRIWEEDMVTPDGRLIPLLVAVGNHDVPPGRRNPQEETVMFYELFSFPQKGISYRGLDFGKYLSLVFLDTGHTYPIEGAQTAWLKEALEVRQDRDYRLVIYHVAAYPAYYPFDKMSSRKIRENWVPLFEKYGIPVAFENHNHCYKKTKELNGTVYLGDGSWGVPPREPRKGLDYIERAEAINMYYWVTIKDKMTIESRGVAGEAPLILEAKTYK